MISNLSESLVGDDLKILIYFLPLIKSTRESLQLKVG